MVELHGCLTALEGASEDMEIETITEEVRDMEVGQCLKLFKENMAAFFAFCLEFEVNIKYTSKSSGGVPYEGYNPKSQENNCT